MMNGSDSFVGPVNIGRPEEFTILQLAELIITLCTSKSRVVFEPLPQADPLQRRPDITLAKEQFQWQPNINLEQGLKKRSNIFAKAVGLDDKGITRIPVFNTRH